MKRGELVVAVWSAETIGIDTDMAVESDVHVGDVGVVLEVLEEGQVKVLFPPGRVLQLSTHSIVSVKENKEK